MAPAWFSVGRTSTNVPNHSAAPRPAKLLPLGQTYKRPPPAGDATLRSSRRAERPRGRPCVLPRGHLALVSVLGTKGPLPPFTALSAVPISCVLRRSGGPCFLIPHAHGTGTRGPVPVSLIRHSGLHRDKQTCGPASTVSRLGPTPGLLCLRRGHSQRFPPLFHTADT